MFLLVFILSGMFFSAPFNGDTVKIDRRVEVTSSRLFDHSTGQRKTELINDRFNSNLSEMLAMQSAVFIRQGSPGGLATPSFRGGSSYHTAVLWNGFNLQSPLNGTVDMSLFPLFFADKVSLVSGGSSALFGSGAMGGVIDLQSELSADKGPFAKVMLCGTDYGDKRAYMSGGYSGTKNTVKAGALIEDNTNTFNYRDHSQKGFPVTRRKNSDFLHRSLFAEDRLVFGNNSVWAKVWYQNAVRGLPSSASPQAYRAEQEDDNFRAVAGYSRFFRKSSLAIRAAFLKEGIDYTDKVLSFTSNAAGRTSVWETEFRRSFRKNDELLLGAAFNYQEASADGFGGAFAHWFRPAVIASYRAGFFDQKLVVAVSGRAEYFRSELLPPTGKAGLDYALLRSLKIKSCVSRNYRLPTFNDMYWVPGGNPDLKPESGLCAEGGLYFDRLLAGMFRLRSEGLVFSNTVSNWILWTPGPSFWSPKNIQEVWARGFEALAEFSVNAGKAGAAAIIRYNYNLSKVTGTSDPGAQNTVGKQLPYVPIYNTQSDVCLSYGQVKATVNHVYTFYRYTTTDNSRYLDPFSVVHVTVSAKAKIKGLSAEPFFRVNNLFDRDYSVVDPFSMPLRNFLFGVLIQAYKP